MMMRNTAVTMAALAALGSAAVAALVVQLLLARPLDVVNAVSSHDAGGLVLLVVATLQDLLIGILELL
jgi:hypothetical protein